MTKVLFISGIRSDYDLLVPLAKLMKKANDFEVSFFLCAPHYSHLHNYSHLLVQADGFEIVSNQLDKQLSLDGTVAGRLDLAAKLLKDLNEVIETQKPDLVIYLGDREEPLMAATCCAYRNIPTVHIAGGDHCYPAGGDVDEPVRHAISKLSSLHLVMAEAHKDRLMKMGEEPSRVAVVGNAGLDSIVATPVMAVNDIPVVMDSKISDNYAVLIHHVMSSVKPSDALHEYKAIISSCIESGLSLYIGAPNSDPGFSSLTEYAFEVARENPKKIFLYKNLGRKDFINLLRNASLIIGNSSLGILEAGFLEKPVINVGERQRGRLHGKNVSFVQANREQICGAIKDALTKSVFDASDRNLYGDGTMATTSIAFIRKHLAAGIGTKHLTY